MPAVVYAANATGLTASVTKVAHQEKLTVLFVSEHYFAMVHKPVSMATSPKSKQLWMTNLQSWMLEISWIGTLSKKSRCDGPPMQSNMAFIIIAYDIVPRIAC